MIALASASPRRAAMLEWLGVPFRAAPANIDETPRRDEFAATYALRLAREKAMAVRAAVPVLGADTAVTLDGRIFGKPRDAADGVAMLLALSGRVHAVFTGVALCAAEREACRLAVARVRFRRIEAAEAKAYWNTGEPADKAGGYGIQGIGGAFVSHIDGSPGAVVGQPLRETCDLLRSFDIQCWPQAPRPGGLGAGAQGACGATVETRDVR